MATQIAPTGIKNNESRKKWIMVIDLAKCIGCKSCTVACIAENSQKSGDRYSSWSPVYEFAQEGNYPNVIDAHFPRPCMHCSDAPCITVCPTGASHYDKNFDTVQINYEVCIGCRYCMTACPYEARQYNWKENTSQPYHNPDNPARPRGVVEKCTFCIHLMEKGIYTPACVEACVADARFFGDMNDSNSVVSKKLRRRNDKFLIKENLGTKPNVWYLPDGNPKAEEE